MDYGRNFIVDFIVVVVGGGAAAATSSSVVITDAKLSRYKSLCLQRVK